MQPLSSAAAFVEDPEVCGIPAVEEVPIVKEPVDNLSPSVVFVDNVPRPNFASAIEDDHFKQPAAGSVEAAAAAEPGAVQTEWEVLEPEERGLSVETAIERVLLLVLDPAIGGMPGVQSADSRASELLLGTEGDVEKAIRLMSEEEINFQRKQLIIEFLLKQSILPFFLGVPFSFLLNAFINIRSVAVVARLYGHKLDKPRTRHEILLCLLPQGPSPSSVPSGDGRPGETGQSAAEGLKQTARSVARAMAGPLLGRATGISMAGDILALGSDLVVSSSGAGSSAGDGQDFSVVQVTPVMTARHYFCPEVTSEWLRVQTAVLTLGMLLPTLLNANLKVYFGLLNLAILAVACAEKFKVPRVRITGVAVLLFFVVYSLLPLLNFVSAFNLLHRALAAPSITDASLVNRLSLLLLGVLNLAISLARQSVPDTWHRLERPLALTRLSLCTLVIPQVISLAAEESPPAGSGASLHFSAWYLSALLSSFCQQRLLEILKRREAFLKLLGAERVLTLSLTLLLKGLTRNVTEELRKFLAALTPPPAVVCALHATKLHALEMALLLSAVPRISELLLPGTLNFYLGVAGGGAVLGLMAREWTERDYSSSNRIFLIMPGEIDAKVKELLTSTGSRAARLVFFSMIRAMFTSLVRKFTAINIS